MAKFVVGQVAGYGLAGAMELRLAKEEFSRAHLLYSLASERLDAAEREYLDASESSGRQDEEEG